MLSLREECQSLLAMADPVAKAQAVTALPVDALLDSAQVIAEIPGLPGRQAKPVLLAHTEIKLPRLNTRQGHGALLHSIVHIERNAIDLALDICWRFSGMPEAFYRDWFKVAREEALHFTLLRNHLLTLGYEYGEFPAHNGLWDMAQRTSDDVLARVALVPRTLEARGLDASPAVRNKLISIGDHRGGEIMAIILRDEIGHVAIGNHWYGWLCAQRGLEPVATYQALALKYEAPKLKGPFNLPARRAAGFSEAEIAALEVELTASAGLNLSA